MSADAADADAADAADAAAERRLNHSIPRTYFVRGIQLMHSHNISINTWKGSNKFFESMNYQRIFSIDSTI